MNRQETNLGIYFYVPMLLIIIGLRFTRLRYMDGTLENRDLALFGTFWWMLFFIDTKKQEHNITIEFWELCYRYVSKVKRRKMQFGEGGLSNPVAQIRASVSKLKRRN